MLARPVALLQHLRRRQLVPLYCRPVRFAFLDNLKILGLVPELVFPSLVPVDQLDQSPFLVVDLIILGNPDFVLVDPFLVVRLSYASLRPRHRVGVGIIRFKLGSRHHVGDEAPLRVTSIGVKVHREAVPDPLDDDDLIEGLRRLVFGQDAPVPPTPIRRLFKAGIVGNRGVAVPLDGSYQTAIELRDIPVRFVADRIDLDLRPVLSRLVYHLPNKHRQFVDRQAWTIVQVAISDDILRPLALTRLVLQIVESGLPVLSLGLLCPLEALLRPLQYGLIGVFLLILLGSQSNRLFVLLRPFAPLAGRGSRLVHSRVGLRQPYLAVV